MRFAYQALDGNYRPDGTEFSNEEKTRMELDRYEQTPGFGVDPGQRDLIVPAWPDWDTPKWAPNYQEQQFRQMTDPEDMFPVT